MPRDPFPVDAVQRDRAVGALLATAAGDALGAGYRLKPPLPPSDPVEMIGRDVYAPGEWTDHTAMAIAVAEIASFASDLTAPARLDDLVQRWEWWARTAKGVGLDATCLTRTVPVALATLGPDDERSAAHAARTLCELTHPGSDAADAGLLWTLAVRHAVRTGELDLRIGLGQIAEERREVWATRIGQAEQSRPADFADATDDVVAVLQAAWSAITTTDVPQRNPAAGVFRADHLRLALEAAVRGGGHTDTVAAVAGGLLGATYGASALPWQWRAILRGWPGLRTHGLAALADKIVNGGESNRIEVTGFWREEPAPQRHPRDDGVWIGVAARLEKLPKVEAVVSLCPVADEDMPPGVLHLEVRLDQDAGSSAGSVAGSSAQANANLDFVLLDTVRAIEALRAAGVSVFVHGRATRSRAPVIAALYGARRGGIDIDQALAEVCGVLPDADVGDDFRAALRRLSPSTERSAR